MDEAAWLACREPGPMLESLRGRPDDRRLRLFACAACRACWGLLTEERSRRAVAEDFRARRQVARIPGHVLATVKVQHVLRSSRKPAATARHPATPWTGEK